jgi:diguanylate cyclase (GGDEF)-like protein/PAS domain S-box-containing protein
MLGFGEDAIGNSPEEWFSRAHPDDRGSLMETFAGRRHGERGPFEIEHRIRSADGTYRWVLCRGLGVPEDGRPANRLVGSLTDITERRSLEEQLLHQALYDNLTGLPNRALFLDRLSQAIAHARRTPGYEYAVLWLDLDGFKVVNDSLGHLVGDELLVRVAARITVNLRDADTAARFGGDEFAVLLHQIPEFTAVEAIVSRLQDDLGQPYDLDGHEVVVTASIGIATGANGYDRADDVLRDADIAMYRAKSAGRAGYATFDSSMFAGAITRLQTETALRQAIEQDQLELHYQPIVDLANGSMQAMEVLVRWRHPLRGLISPGEFLPVAEESGLIVPMGRWVEMEACRQLYAWKAEGLVSANLRASINLSNREFWNPGLLNQIDQVLAATGVPAEWLVFEITEGVIMHNLERALEVLGELHARGVQIHIDDFGTGYSSLEALHRLPIDALKIDRSFVANLQDNKSTELVRTIVQLGRNLGVDVIAEGIETPAQQHALAELGCPFGQGYWFSVPVPAGRLGELLTMTSLPAPSEAIPRAEGGAGPHKSQVVRDKPRRKGGLRLVTAKSKRPVAPVDLSLVTRPGAADALLSEATPQTPRR